MVRQMAKDGTARGGQRVGSGRKNNALADKITTGRMRNATVLPEPPEMEGLDMPPVREYMLEKQKDGHTLCAEDVYRETYEWLKQRKCEKLVSRQLIDQYAMSVARWIQCEQAISEYGFLAKHPTTGGAIASPFVSMAQQYLKQINQLWYQIYQVVKENCSVDYGGASPNDDLMERLLNARKG